MDAVGVFAAAADASMVGKASAGEEGCSGEMSAPDTDWICLKAESAVSDSALDGTGLADGSGIGNESLPVPWLRTGNVETLSACGNVEVEDPKM